MYPNKEQQVLLEKHFGATRWVYNYGLEKKVKAYQKDKTNLSCLDIIKELPSLKRQNDTAWLSEINAQALQMSLRNLDNAYTKFFRENAGFPNFKGKYGKQSFSMPQENRALFSEGYSKFSKIGKIKTVFSRTFEGKIKTATISKNSANQYFVSFLVEDGEELPEKKKVTESTTTGVDLGLKDYIVTSEGKRVQYPKYLRQSEQRLAVLQRRLSRKKKGGKNREKAKLQVARLHNKIKNQRADFIHKLTHELISENQTTAYALETLQVQNMQKNRRLSKSISDAAWAEFVRQMKYKADWNGKSVLQIGTFEPSSKTCLCGEINSQLTLSDRTWTCKECGQENDRDLTAAINIKRFALKK